MSQTVDLFANLSDDWWLKATAAQKWKPKYECTKEIFGILTGRDYSWDRGNVNVDLKGKFIEYHAKFPQLLGLLVQWLENERHVFTRIGILRLLPCLLRSAPRKPFNRYNDRIMRNLMVEQWTEKKHSLLVLVNPLLIQLLLTHRDIAINSEHLHAALKHRGKESRASACDFLAHCTLYPLLLKQVNDLCSGHNGRELADLLAKLAASDKEKEVRQLACKAWLGLSESRILKASNKTVDKQFAVQYERLIDTKRCRKNLIEARKQYTADQKTAGLLTQDRLDDDDDEKSPNNADERSTFEFLPFLKDDGQDELPPLDETKRISYDAEYDEVSWDMGQDEVSVFGKAEAGYKIISDEFTMCGATWQFELYPNGKDFYHEDWCSVYLRCTTLPVCKERLGVNYRIIMRGLSSTKVFHGAYWYRADKSFGFAKMAKQSLFYDIKRLRVTCHLEETCRVDQGYMSWRFGKHYTQMIRHAAEASAGYDKNRSIKSPPYTVMGVRWQIHLIPGKSKIILHVVDTSVNHNGRITCFEQLSCDELNPTKAAKDQPHTFTKNKGTISYKIDPFSLAGEQQINMRLDVWSNQRRFTVNVDKSEVHQFVLNGLKWCLVHQSKEDRLHLLLMGYWRTRSGDNQYVPMDVLSILSGYSPSTSTLDDAPFYVENSLDVQLQSFPIGLNSVKLRRSFTDSTNGVRSKTSFAPSSQMVSLFKERTAYYDTSSKFVPLRYTKSITVDVEMDIVSLQYMKNTTNSNLKRIIRTEAAYKRPKATDLDTGYHIASLTKYQMSVEEWRQNTAKLNALWSEIQNQDTESGDSENLWLNFTTFWQLVTANVHRSRSAGNDIAAIIDVEEKLQSLMKQNGVELEATTNSLDAMNKEYSGLRQTREQYERELAANTKQKAEFLEDIDSHYSQYVASNNAFQQTCSVCNTVIEAENRLYAELQTLNEKKQTLEAYKREIVHLLKQFEPIMDFYQSEVEKNGEMVEKIQQSLNEKWNVLESHWWEWTPIEIVRWFKYKTRKYRMDIVDWPSIEKQMQSQQIGGKSLMSITETNIAGVGICDVDIVRHLMAEINGLKTSYPCKSEDSNESKEQEAPKEIDSKLPAKFVCPLTKKLMKEPVIAFDGYSYEKSAIQQYLQTQKKSPMTNEAVTIDVLFPNIQLKQEIAAFNAMK